MNAIIRLTGDNLTGKSLTIELPEGWLKQFGEISGPGIGGERLRPSWGCRNPFVTEGYRGLTLSLSESDNHEDVIASLKAGIEQAKDYLRKRIVYNQTIEIDL